MSISSTKGLLLVLVVFCFYTVKAQNHFETLGETAFAVNHKVSSNYSINFSVRDRYYVYQNQSFNVTNRQIDLVHFSTLKLNHNHSLSFGLQYRFRDVFDGRSNEIRLTQQFNYTKKNRAIRFGHRVRFEQRILDQTTILRLRYRFAMDFPLNGEKLNVGEKYLVATTEALLSKSDPLESELDQRTTAQIGWLITEKLKLQFGLGYRFEAISPNTKEKLFVLTSAIMKL